MDPRLEHLQVSFSIAPLLIALAVSAAAKAFANHKKGKAAANQAQEAAQLQHDAGLKQWDQKEAQRVALLNSLKNGYGAGGPKVQALLSGLDPSLFAARPYPGAEVGKETGYSVAGSIGEGISSAADQYAGYSAHQAGEKQRAAESQRMFCALVPNAPGCEGTTSQAGV